MENLQEKEYYEVVPMRFEKTLAVKKSGFIFSKEELIDFAKSCWDICADYMHKEEKRHSNQI